MRQIITDLGRLRGRSRVMLIMQRAAVLLAWLIGSLIVLGLIDWVLRLPGAFRLLLLFAGLGSLGWSTWRYFLPVLGFRPTLTDVALRVERALPGVEGRLASAVEFAGSGLDSESGLAARSVRDAQSRLAGAELGDVLDHRRTRRDVGMFLGVFVVAILFVAITPAAAGTSLNRLLFPLGTAQWPARTGVGSLMDSVQVHPQGQSLALRAVGTKAPGGELDDMDISAHYRTQTKGEFGPWREAVLTPQGNARYERLVDTDADAIEFYFESDDARTTSHQIDLVPPPAVLQATLVVSPPEYAIDHVPTQSVELGPGLDERSITDTPSLVGSTAKLTLRLNKPIPIGSTQGIEHDQWLASTLGWTSTGENRPVLVSDPGSTNVVTITWPVDGTVTMALDLVDRHGLGNADDIAYRIDAVEDRLPSVTITEPESDRAVLNTAVLPLVSEARDDVAIAQVGLEARRQLSGAADQSEFLWDRWEDARLPMGRIEHEIDLAELDLTEGDIIQIAGLAEDVYYLEGDQHITSRSAIRRLRIISDRDFGEALFRELKALRQNAIRLEGQQAELQDDVIAEGVQPGIGPAQDRITERIADQLEDLARLDERKEMNRFEDHQLESLIDQARDLLSHAGQASSDAGQNISDREQQPGNQPPGEPNSESGDARSDRGGGATEDRPSPTEGGAQANPGGQQPPTEPNTTEEPEETDNQPEVEQNEPREEDREIVDRQQEVRDELRDLIEALDRNEDTWVMNQRIKDLLGQQSQLQSETGSLNEQTRGRSVDELNEQEVTELDRIAQRQKELAEQMRDLVDELRDRADDLAEVDPQAAESQRAAADTAEEREVDRNMEDAANSAQQNQLQNTQNSQQKAREGLEQMLNDLDRKRAQTEELQRRLASLIESIKRLVHLQETELNELGRAQAESNFLGRDRAMIRLNQNTQVVAAEARATGRETARIARTLDRAADAQGAAVTALRETPLDSEGADAAERRSLELLKEAQELAEELEQDVEEDLMQQRREELLGSYRELAEREVVLRSSTLELQELDQLGRRELVEARRQGNTQDDIRLALDTILLETQEVSGSRVFSHVHGLLDEWAVDVIDTLRDGDVSVSVTDRQRSIAEAIGRLIAALEEEMSEPDEFEEDSGGGGGGGGGGDQPPQPLVPPVAELKLLKGMQQHIYDHTRDIDGRDDLDDGGRRQRLRELGRQQEDLSELGQELMDALTGGEGGPNETEGGAE